MRVQDAFRMQALEDALYDLAAYGEPLYLAGVERDARRALRSYAAQVGHRLDMVFWEAGVESDLGPSLAITSRALARAEALRVRNALAEWGFIPAEQLSPCEYDQTLND